MDDGSTDGSISVLTRLHDEMTNVVVVHLRRNFGKAAALQAGFLEARGDIVVTIDADLQDDPAEIPQLLAKLDEGFDLVSGWKTRRNDPLRATALLAHVQLGDRRRVRRAAPRRQLRAEGVPRGGAAGNAPLRRAAPLHPRPRRRTAGSASPRSRSTTGRASTAARATGRSATCAASSTCSSVTFMGRYRHRPLHLFGGVGRPHGSDRLRDPPLPHDRSGSGVRRSDIDRC